LEVLVPEGDPRPDFDALLRANIPRIEQALYLMHLYGSLGGRSRNGWGSFILQPVEGTASLGGRVPFRDWEEALKLDWPHALGADKADTQGIRPLIWQTQQTYTNWEDALRDLARVKVGLRTQLALSGTPAQGAPDRCWLAYPITNHWVANWGPNARLPNSLHFKVRPAPDKPQEWVGVIFHMPCSPPKSFQQQKQSIVKTWKAVHRFLDELALPDGQRSLSWITNADLQQQIADLVADVVLKRVQE